MLLFHYQLFLSSFDINVNTGLLKKYRDTRIQSEKEIFYAMGLLVPHNATRGRTYDPC